VNQAARKHGGIPGAFLLVAGLMAAGLWWLSTLPLWHTDLWGHLAYGRWITEHGQLPATEPLMPLAVNAPFVDSAWLSQWLGYQLWRCGGVAALQFAFAASVMAAVGLLLDRLRRKTGSLLWGCAEIGFLFLLERQQWFVGTSPCNALIRPQLAGLVAFVFIFTRLERGTLRRSDWILLPLTLALWANLHGSFILGLGLLAVYTLGRFLDVWRRTGSGRRALGHRRLRQLAGLMLLCALAGLINPYGAGLYREVLTFAADPNLQALVEWRPLGTRLFQAQAAIAVAVLLGVVYCVTPRRRRAAELILLLGLGVAMAQVSRFLHWWAIPAAYFAALHGHAVGRSLFRRLGKAWRTSFPANRPTTADIAPRTGDAVGQSPLTELPQEYSAANLFGWIGGGLLIAAAVVATPLGQQEIRGKSLSLQDQVSRATPVALTEHLRQHPPRGQVFNAYEWGDYLVWAGPPELPIFVHSHAHLVPPEVWEDYRAAVRAWPGWRETMSKYRVGTIVIDRSRTALLGELRRSPDWELAYEDATGSVFRRRGS